MNVQSILKLLGLWSALVFLLGAVTGCSTGSGQFNANDVDMNTQFEVSWGTSVKIGFPGTINGSGSAEGTKAAKPAEPTTTIEVPNP